MSTYGPNQPQHEHEQYDPSERIDLGKTQPVLPTSTTQPPEVVYSVFRMGESPRDFWPEQMQPRSWQKCRLCGEEPVATAFYGREHMQYRFLGIRCRHLVTEHVKAFASVFRVDPLLVLDTAFKYLRDLEAEDQFARQVAGRIGGDARQMRNTGIPSPQHPIPTPLPTPAPVIGPTAGPSASPQGGFGTGAPRSRPLSWDV